MAHTTTPATYVEHNGREGALVLLVLLLAAFALRMGTWSFLPNTHHPDEVFQTIEPAHRLLTGVGVVTWEWATASAPGCSPAFLPPS